MRYVYLAGPISGLTYNGATDWRDEFAVLLERQDVTRLEPPNIIKSLQWKCLSPMRGKSFLKDNQSIPSTFKDGSDMVDRDLFDIRRSEAVLINLLGMNEVSIGTMCELGYAYALNKYVIVVGEESHIFIDRMSSVRVKSLDHALLKLGVL